MYMFELEVLSFIHTNDTSWELKVLGIYFCTHYFKPKCNEKISKLKGIRFVAA